MASVRNEATSHVRWGLAKRVLLIDREIWNRDSIAADLSREGCDVIAVGNPVEALQTLSEEAFDLVIVDLAFPDAATHGGGVVWEDFLVLQRLQRAGAPPFIATSSEGDQFRTQSLDAGARDFLHKPFSPERLVQSIERVCTPFPQPALK